MILFEWINYNKVNRRSDHVRDRGVAKAPQGDSMTQVKWTIRLGVVGAVLTIAILAISTCRAANPSVRAATPSATASAASH